MENQPIVESANTSGNLISKVLYTGKVHITGGREGAAKSSDERLNVTLSAPGGAGSGTNPEQLFAAGWSACFIGAMRHNAAALQIALPQDTAIDAEVDLATGPDGFTLQARLNVSLPGLSLADASKVIEAAHQTCPYSKATRGNIHVEINLSL
ncbi:organic hydroperoxide resistance protein [Mucilaginibacter sp. BJC16-A38]|uniref:organic hydroperoxide resistance protein n=1 Tax=Mucilaginibacter phenanthrenivorans TaxID=1234842 RepID=UPI0021577F4F|nr:organic hydroperoxide resistance protein [Mucilaginibacter phenanthrenivorans]MCR8557315.1 organic hydroperoxide resistance protein [Mucilaginibacter phenanthrenivorans]